MGIPRLRLTRPRDLDHLVAQLQDHFRLVEHEFRRQQTNAAQKGERFGAARPIEQNDVVRLVDLQESVAFVSTKLNSLSFGGAGPSLRMAAHVGFVEPTDDVTTLFTPLITPAQDENGRPLAILFGGHAGAYIHLTDSDPPEIGRWAWTGTQVKFDVADAPFAGSLLVFGMMVRA